MRTAMIVPALLLATLAAFAPRADANPLPLHKSLQGAPATRIQANFNEYFDSLTGQISQFFIDFGLDPMPLPPQESGFGFKDLLGIYWHGELELTSGWMVNLAHLERANDATLNYEKKLLDIRFELLFDAVQMSYDFRAQIMNLGPTGTVIGKVKKLQILIALQVDIETLEIEVVDIHFTHTGRITVHVESAGLLDLITNSIANTVTFIFKGLIVDVVEGVVRGVFETVLGSIHLGDIILGGGRQPTEAPPALRALYNYN